jgi:hypothetical protein
MNEVKMVLLDDRVIGSFENPRFDLRYGIFLSSTPARFLSRAFAPLFFFAAGGVCIVWISFWLKVIVRRSRSTISRDASTILRNVPYDTALPVV